MRRTRKTEWRSAYRLRGGIALIRAPRDQLMLRATEAMRQWHKTLTPKARAQTMLEH